MTIETTTLPALNLATDDPERLDVDVLVVAAISRADSVEVSAPRLGAEASRYLADAAQAVRYRAQRESTLRIPSPPEIKAASVLLVGLGDSEADQSALGRHELLRRASGSALRSLDSVGSIGLVLPIADAESAEAVATGALLGAYRYSVHRSARADERVLTSIEIVADAATQSALDRAVVVAASVAAARDLVNEPPSHLFPESFAQTVMAQAHADDLRGEVAVEVLSETELHDQGYGGLIGVGSGSLRPPRLVKLTYTPENASGHLALVGKGITFDSGGISLKPAAKMEKMKSDMAGAAAVVQALFAIARLRMGVRVTAWLALAENMPSGSALRPADVLRIYGGKTVEVTNTDAEGRLVLADALVAAEEEHPDLIVDVATLTGAQVAALGYRTSGIMGTTSARERVLRASEAAGESMWAMPIPEEAIRFFDSRTADLKNAGAPAAGMLAAAAFLREFVAPGREWAHIDIAGPAYNADAAYGYTTLGGTGAPVRTLIELARAMEEAL